MNPQPSAPQMSESEMMQLTGSSPEYPQQPGLLQAAQQPGLSSKSLTMSSYQAPSSGSMFEGTNLWIMIVVVLLLCYCSCLCSSILGSFMSMGKK